MITYLYWATTAVIALALLIFFIKNGAIKMGLITTGFIVIVSWAAYFFHFEQMFVKRFGGVMNIEMRDNEVHLGSTWKDDNLWIETYNPETRTCHFREFSKGNLLQGRVNINNCRPINHNTIIMEQKTATPISEATPRKNVINASETVVEDKPQIMPSKPITLDDMPER